MIPQQQTGGPAFPWNADKNDQGDVPGMTLRDYIAARAMQSFLADPDVSWANQNEMDFAAGKAYKMADAMLRARAA